MSETLPGTMRGWHLTGHGDLDRLVFRDDLPVPRPGADEVTIRVAAAGLNNTDVNTRTAWYSKSVRGATGEGGDEAEAGDGGWAGEALDFPRIQGADCCGHIAAVGDGVDPARIGERVLVRTLQTSGPRRAGDPDPFATWTFGSECDGAFAEYACTFAEEALPVESDWSDVELASIPCAWSTAEGMIQRAGIGASPDERVLVTGASGGVGSAAVQLLKARGLHVTGLGSASKAEALRDLGCDAVLGRDDPLPEGAFHAVVDLVAGPRWPDLLDSLRRGGRYVCAGAIAGPIVELDVRTLYLRDLTLYGSTYQPPNILPDVIARIEAGEVHPLVAETWPLAGLIDAQRAFMDKDHVGKIVLRVA